MHAVGTRTVAVAIALTMFACVVAIAGREPLRGTTGEPTAPREESDVVVTPPADFPVSGALPPEVFVIDEESGTPEWLPWTLAGFALTGVLAAALLLVRNFRMWGGKRRRRRRAGRTAPGSTETPPSGVDTDDDAEVARRAVDAALEPLRDPVDPRAAVIAAYAGMEHVLAERELGRRTPEAPREYLTRVLTKRRMPKDSLTTLTALFEEARFSLHQIPDSAPRRALGELENVRIALTMDEGAERLTSRPEPDLQGGSGSYGHDHGRP